MGFMDKKNQNFKTNVWMLDADTIEEAKRHVLSNPYYSDVTFEENKVIRNGKLIGELLYGSI